MKSKLIYALVFFIIGLHNILSSMTFQIPEISVVCFYSGILGMAIGAGFFHSAYTHKETK